MLGDWILDTKNTINSLYELKLQRSRVKNLSFDIDLLCRKTVLKQRSKFLLYLGSILTDDAPNQPDTDPPAFEIHVDGLAFSGSSRAVLTPDDSVKLHDRYLS